MIRRLERKGGNPDHSQKDDIQPSLKWRHPFGSVLQEKQGGQGLNHHWRDDYPSYSASIPVLIFPEDLIPHLPQERVVDHLSKPDYSDHEQG
jgi:hypothetical protein